MVGSTNNNNNEEEDNDNDYDFSYNPIDHETPEERESRMKLVRELQKTFYKDEEGPRLPPPLDEASSLAKATATASSSSDTQTEPTHLHQDDNSLILDLPLWRVQWTELPGSQNVLNVHVPHYTNMFQKILKGQSRRWGDSDSDSGKGGDGIGQNSNGDSDPEPALYFGHVFLPGGSENLDNPDLPLGVGDFGTLMKISDARQQRDDGRLTLVVQALERFEIKNVKRSHSPYAIADVSILPDSEQFQLQCSKDDDDDDDNNINAEAVRAMAVSKALASHPFEYRRVSIDECEITNDDGTVVGVSVSPLSNYDATQVPEVGTDRSNNRNIDADIGARRDRDLLAVAESDTWIQLDELLQLLQIASSGVGVPVPAQMMGLLPLSRSVLSTEEIKSNARTTAKEDTNASETVNASAHGKANETATATATAAVEKVPWPENFHLERFVTTMEGQKTKIVGTHSKSPFVRVDNDADGNRDGYSPLRRAQRLSYVVWTLTESIALPSQGNEGEDKYGKEAILKITSTRERLELATEKMHKICLLLKNVLRLRG